MGAESGNVLTIITCFFLFKELQHVLLIESDEYHFN